MAPQRASLRVILEDSGSLAPEQSVAVILAVLSDLSDVHARGIVHGDVRPNNVIVDAAGVVKLNSPGPTPEQAGPTGGIAFGTPAYMSPEAASGGEVDNRSDLYSTGAMLFELLCGYVPYAGGTPLTTMIRQVSAAVPDPGDGYNCPEGMRELVMRSLAKNPENRPQTADAFHSALEAAATAGYGDRWEERSSLQRRVAISPPLRILATVAPAKHVAKIDSPELRIVAVLAGASGRLTQRPMVLAGAAGGVALLSLGGAAGLALLNSNRPSPGPTGGVLAIGINNVLPSPSPSPTPSPSPAESPSPEASPTPSPSPQAPSEGVTAANPAPPDVTSAPPTAAPTAPPTSPPTPPPAPSPSPTTAPRPH